MLEFFTVHDIYKEKHWTMKFYPTSFTCFQETGHSLAIGTERGSRRGYGSLPHEEHLCLGTHPEKKARCRVAHSKNKKKHWKHIQFSKNCFQMSCTTTLATVFIVIVTISHTERGRQVTGYHRQQLTTFRITTIGKDFYCNMKRKLVLENTIHTKIRGEKRHFLVPLRKRI